MATVEVRNLDGATVKQLELADEVFAVEAELRACFGKPSSSIWQASAEVRIPPRAADEVSGGGKKPWRQKGTGRARVGSIRSSLWRHGSIAHGPKPRDYSYAIPEKMLRGALRSALAAKFLEHKLTVVDQLGVGEAKTKVFAGALKKLGVEKTVLVVNDAADRNLELSSRNVEGCDLVRHHRLHPYQVLSHDQLLISEGAITRLQESLL